MTTQHAKSNAREGDGVAGLPPEAVPVGPDGLRFGVISSHDWAIPAPFGARIVDARMAHGWNECRKEMIAMQAQQGADSPHWTSDKPQCAGVYGVRGFDAGADPEDQYEAVVSVREYRGELVCNLHESTSDAEFDDWWLVSDLSADFEWCRFIYAAAPATGAPR